MSITRTLVTASLVAALGAMAPAAAAKGVSLNENGERTVQIDVSDLNLGHVAGQKTLENRIRVAVRKVCGRAIGPMPIKDAQAIRKCTRTASGTALVLANRGDPVTLAVRDASGTR